MNYPEYFDPKNSLNLYGFEKDFVFLSSLYANKKLPKILMLSGPRGSGKSTLINHLLFSIFDEKNYNKNQLSFSEASVLFKQFINNIFQNIIYLKGSNFKSVKIEDIRNLKSKILKSSIINKDRFIIFDDVELFNINSLNALLKIIEEPSANNYFILINNKSKPLLDTVKSRSLELKVILSEDIRLEIIDRLIKLYNIETILDPKKSKLTPGNFIKFNYICKENNIFPENEFLDNLSLLLNSYKKDKDILFIDIAFFLAEIYFKELKTKNILRNEQIYEIKNFVLNNLNNYLTFNVNQNSLVNAINDKLRNG